MGEQRCRGRCGEVKPLDAFRQNRRTGHYRTVCKECQLADANERRRRKLELDPEYAERVRRKAAHRLARYRARQRGQEEPAAPAFVPRPAPIDTDDPSRYGDLGLP